jgi:pyridoxamine 5'-phosphate oxidase
MANKRLLSENTVDPDPFKQFKEWYDEHLSSGIQYPDSVSLATSFLDGKVSVRTVLMKEYSETGFVFFTNYNSKKGKQLFQNPNAAMMFFWSESGRQIRIEGVVEKVSDKESHCYFDTRPRESQIGAWASEQSYMIPGLNHLEKRIVFFENKFSGMPVEKPAHWGGFRLIPDLIEFWQEGEFRIHDRILYTRRNHSWHIDRLAP